MKLAPLSALLLASVVGLTQTAAAQGPQLPASQSAPMPLTQSMDAAAPRPTLQLPTSGPFLGGVPTGTPTGTVETITIVQALTRALAHNLGALTAEQNIGRNEGARKRALSELLPNVDARVAETRQVINLAAFGLGTGADSPFADIGTIVGPFNVFDARVYLSQSVFDLHALNDARAEAHNVQAARHLYKGARDFVLYVSGTLYVQASRCRRG